MRRWNTWLTLNLRRRGLESTHALSPLTLTWRPVFNFPTASNRATQDAIGQPLRTD
jgi:hypothetical protein